MNPSRSVDGQRYGSGVPETAADRFFALIDVSGDEDERLTKRLLVGASLMISVVAAVWGTAYLMLGEGAAAAVGFAYAGSTLAGLLSFRTHGRVGVFRSSQLAALLVVPFVLGLVLGGLAGSGGVIMWSLLAPLGALVLAGTREARMWFLGYLVLLVSALAVDPLVRDRSDLGPQVLSGFLAMNISVVSIVSFVLLRYFTAQRAVALAASEQLLLNVLPAPIAEQLRAGSGTIAEQYDEVSILFADIVGFTPMSATMPAGDLVDVLNEVFTYIDGEAADLGVEKIKTIGDCYMAAAGLPDRRADHADALVELAVRVRDHFAAHEVGGHRLGLRIGINSGPVVAGVIGTTRFIYDLWGDAVNTASRMESHGDAGTIQITETTRLLVDRHFRCEPVGTIDVKGKGPMDVWRVVGRRNGAP